MSAIDDLLQAATMALSRAPGDVASLELAALRYVAARVRATGEVLTTELGPTRMADFLEDLSAEAGSSLDGDRHCDTHFVHGQIAAARHKQIDQLAGGPLPRSRVALPKIGERCPRCHRSARNQACLLCCPDLVPASWVAACPKCYQGVGAECVTSNGDSIGDHRAHAERACAAALILAWYDAEALGAGYVRIGTGGVPTYIPMEQLTIFRP